MSSPISASSVSHKSSTSPLSNSSSTSSAKSVGQYLHPDFVEPVSSGADPKQSPLALLVKTCDSIGKLDGGGDKASARTTPALSSASRPNSRDSVKRSSPLLMKKEAAKQASSEETQSKSNHPPAVKRSSPAAAHKRENKSPGHSGVHPYHPFLNYGHSGSHLSAWGIPEGHTASVCACPHCVHARTLMEYLYGSCMTPQPTPISPPTPQAEFCIYCGKHCPTPEELVRHMRSHDSPAQTTAPQLPIPFYPANLSPTAQDTYRKWGATDALSSHRFHPYRGLFNRLPFPHYGAPLV